MGWLSRVVRPKAEFVTSSRELAQIMGGFQTDSGAFVGPEQAMRTAAVYSCVRVVSEGVAMLPLVLYRRTPEGRQRAADHPVYTVLHDQMNPWCTAFEGWEQLQAHLELRGEAFGLRTLVRGETRELFPLHPDRVACIEDGAWGFRYQVTLPDGRSFEVGPDRMVHLRGLSLDGRRGVSTIAYQRESIGLAIQLVKHGARLFRNGAQIGGVLTHSGLMSEEAAERLKESIEEKLSGADNAHRLLLLEEGVKYEKIGMTAEDAQFLESRKYSRSEIAGFFRVPPHMIGDLERATFSNIEHQGISFVTQSLGARLARIEQRVKAQLLKPEERRDYYAEFHRDALLRGDTLARFQAYQIAVQVGWMNRNEVRERENMNRGGPELDRFLEPAFLTGGDSASTPPAGDPPADGEDPAEPPAPAREREDRERPADRRQGALRAALTALADTVRRAA